MLRRGWERPPEHSGTRTDSAHGRRTEVWSGDEACHPEEHKDRVQILRSVETCKMLVDVSQRHHHIQYTEDSL